MNVTIPKLYYSYKINTKKLGLEQRLIIKYLSIYFDSLFGSSSNFEEEIINEKITNDGLDFIISKTDSHILVTWSAIRSKYLAANKSCAFLLALTSSSFTFFSMLSNIVL